MKGKREYRIINSTLGYNIIREREAEIWFLGANRWVLEKKYAKTFYTQQDAINNLPLVRIKDRWGKLKTESDSKEETDSKKGWIKESWSEYSWH